MNRLRMWWRQMACLAAAGAYAGEDVDEVRQVPADPIVLIENVRGEVAVYGWDRHEVAVSGELDDLAEELVFEVDGRHVRIAVQMPRRDVNWGDGSDLVIRVPAASRIGFEGVSTDLEVKGIKGGARLRTVSGEIDIEDVGGPLIVNTVSGDGRIGGANDRAQVTTISGEIELETQGRALMVDTVSGDVEAELGDFEELSGRSVSGDIRLAGRRLLPPGRVDLDSVSGDIQLRLDKPVDAELRVKSGIGGEIHNDLTGDRPRDIFPAQQELIVKSGDGSGRIRINTVSADVRLN